MNSNRAELRRRDGVKVDRQVGCAWGQVERLFPAGSPSPVATALRDSPRELLGRRPWGGDTTHRRFIGGGGRVPLLS